MFTLHALKICAVRKRNLDNDIKSLPNGSEIEKLLQKSNLSYFLLFPKTHYLSRFKLLV